MFLGALPALIMPVFIVGGILGGWFTPTEAAVVASLYALFLGLVLYRELREADLAGVLWDSIKQTVQVMFIIAAAAPFGWVLIQQQIPNAIINAILDISTTPWVILLMVNVILLVLGMFIEGIAMFLRFPKSLSYASMPVAGLLMMAYAVSGIGQALTGPRAGGEGLSGRERG